MKKTIATLAVLAMAFGNIGYAQSRADYKSSEKEIVFKHYGFRNDDIKPAEAVVKTTDNEVYRLSYTYDENDFYRVESLTEKETGNGWTPVELVSYEYDFTGSVLEMVASEWENGGWQESDKASYTYTADGMEVVYQSFENNAWQNSVKEVYNYNGDETTVLFWDWNGSTWTSNKLHTYTYRDTSIEVLKQYMQGGAWQNEEKVTFSMDFSGHVQAILYETWNNNAWVNDERVTYNYEDEIYTSMLVEEWENGAWHDDKSFSFTYDDGNAIRGLCMEMQGGQWMPADGDIEMAYDHSEASDVYSGCEVNVTYIDVTAIGEPGLATSFSVYPIPAENEIHIMADGFQKAEVYSVTGQKLMESLNDKMNVGSLGQGVYLLKVYDLNGNSETQRIVIK